MIQLTGKTHDLGGGLTIHRVLPDRTKRMVGPFTFLDHMGPLTTEPNQNTDVRPHPHIGLSTLTYLYQGRIVHRDSLGMHAEITPGEVNWMTAGKGISHSERTHESERHQARQLHGLQFWVALPEDQEDCDPSFQHYDKNVIPKLENDDFELSLVSGEGFGLQSPVKTTSPLIFADVRAKKDFDFNLNIPGFELGLYMVDGTGLVEQTPLSTFQMAVAEKDQKLTARIQKDSRFVIIGGEPFANPRFMWWNLVSSSKEKIEKAKQDWQNGSFPMVPGETEFIPLPSK
jgi:redox-sensitive bicupin YhaK (pirin superfamily)